MKQKFKNEIRKNGAQILKSDLFTRATMQTHHHRTTVGRHSLHVASSALSLCNCLEHFGIRPDRKAVVQAALLHDLGIVGRHEKYANNLECLKGHPSDSAKIAINQFQTNNPKIEEMIRRHMWPLNPGTGMPNSLEAWILMLADKQASVSEVLL